MAFAPDLRRDAPSSHPLVQRVWRRTFPRRDAAKARIDLPRDGADGHGGGHGGRDHKRHRPMPEAHARQLIADVGVTDYDEELLHVTAALGYIDTIIDDCFWF